jgi:thiamine-monophosphate kinase
LSDEVALGPGAEFDTIRALLARWGARAIGVGDDAATLSVARGDQLVVSVDSAVERRHFRPEWSTPREIGYRAVVAALSDLAAMAAIPTGILLAITLPDAWRAKLDELADGIAEGADTVRAPIIGGNMSGGTELAITTTVLGSAFAPLRRGGARVGDSVYVTGVLGGPAAALRSLEAGHGVGAHHERLKFPCPRVHEARWLAERGATAAIDISDGFIADLRHVAAASRVTIDVVGASVPHVDEVTLNTALSGGEEYELIVTTARAFDVEEFRARFGLLLTQVGRVTDGERAEVTLDGARVANISGHDHFSR